MGAEEQVRCPKCGTTVSARDKFCRNCAADLQALSNKTIPDTTVKETLQLPSHTRKFSVVQRTLKTLVSPRIAMKDIAMAPDYGAPTLIVILLFIINSAGILLASQHTRFVGSPSQIKFFQTTSYDILTLAVIFGCFAGFLKWIVKSLIVKAGCNSESGWKFKSAASVTGYAYIAQLVVDTSILIVSLFLYPQITYDLSSAEALRQSQAQYKSSLILYFAYILPLTAIGLVWKSYLGGLGTYYGTDKKCSFKKAFAVFIGLGSIGLLYSLLSTLLRS